MRRALAVAVCGLVGAGCPAPGHVVPMHLHPDERSTIGERIEALDDPHPPFAVPGSPMTEIILP